MAGSIEISKSVDRRKQFVHKNEGAGIMEKRNKSNILGNILIIIGVLCLAAGAGIFVKHRMDAKRAQEQAESLKSQVETGISGQAEDASGESQEDASVKPEPVTGTEDAGEGQAGEKKAGEEDAGEEQAGADEEATSEPAASGETAAVNPYADIYSQNEDMVGWLKIDDTNIDYPVMQTMGDENYYLRRNFNKKSDNNGCLILDTDSTITEPLSTNLIIHGHNMKSGNMFGHLTDYESKDYWEKHRYIKLYTKECERNYEVIAVFRSQVFKKTDRVFKFYKFFQADTQEEFDDWYDNIKKLSKYDTGVTAEFGDHFLTLSTCVYHVENGRLAVVAKEIEPGESYGPME